MLVVGGGWHLHHHNSQDAVAVVLLGVALPVVMLCVSMVSSRTTLRLL
jgi:hypothetical protein